MNIWNWKKRIYGAIRNTTKKVWPKAKLFLFLHYKTFKEAKEKWLERTKRINKDNICLILTCKDGYTLKDIKAFDKLKYKNKVVFVPEKYNNFNSSFYIKNSEENDEIKFLGTKVNHFGKKIIDDFDIVSFLNSCKEFK